MACTPWGELVLCTRQFERRGGLEDEVRMQADPTPPKCLIPRKPIELACMCREAAFETLLTLKED